MKQIHVKQLPVMFFSIITDFPKIRNKDGKIYAFY